MAQLVPQEIAFADTAPLRAEGSAVLDATPAEVWAVLADHETWPRWFAGVTSCRATSEPASGVGSSRHVVLAGGSSFDERFIAWDEEALWSFTGTAMKPGAFRSLVERVTIEEVAPGRTRVTYRMAIDPKPFLKPLAPLLARAISGNLTKAMRSLGADIRRYR